VTEREASPKCAIGDFAPAKLVALAVRHGSSQISNARRLAEASVGANTANLRCRVDPDSVIEAKTSHPATELT
jgi:hypothetical protein